MYSYRQLVDILEHDRHRIYGKQYCRLVLIGNLHDNLVGRLVRFEVQFLLGLDDAVLIDTEHVGIAIDSNDDIIGKGFRRIEIAPLDSPDHGSHRIVFRHRKGLRFHRGIFVYVGNRNNDGRIGGHQVRIYYTDLDLDFVNLFVVEQGRILDKHRSGSLINRHIVIRTDHIELAADTFLGPMHSLQDIDFIPVFGIFRN